MVGPVVPRVRRLSCSGLFGPLPSRAWLYREKCVYADNMFKCHDGSETCLETGAGQTWKPLWGAGPTWEAQRRLTRSNGASSLQAHDAAHMHYGAERTRYMMKSYGREEEWRKGGGGGRG